MELNGEIKLQCRPFLTPIILPLEHEATSIEIQRLRDRLSTGSELLDCVVIKALSGRE